MFNFERLTISNFDWGSGDDESLRKMRRVVEMLIHHGGLNFRAESTLFINNFFKYYLYFSRHCTRLFFSPSLSGDSE